MNPDNLARLEMQGPGKEIEIAPMLNDNHQNNSMIDPRLNLKMQESQEEYFNKPGHPKLDIKTLLGHGKIKRLDVLGKSKINVKSRD